MYYKSPLDKVYQYLLICLGFISTLTVAGGNLIAGLIVILWLFSGDYEKKFRKIIGSSIAKASILFFLIHLIGLLWTYDIDWGMEISRKMLKFGILFPILLTIVHKKNIDWYLNSFLAGIAITLIFSFMIWLGIIEPFKNAKLINPTPFMSHVSHTPIMVLAAFISFTKFYSFKRLNRYSVIYLLLFLFSSLNVLITLGRVGHMTFLIMIFSSVLIFFGISLKKILLALLIPLTILSTTYFVNDHFKNRIDLTYKESLNINPRTTSMGIRQYFLFNTTEIIKNNLFFGVGTGDFPSSYSIVNMKNSPNLPIATNPHNMYFLILGQLGLVGLFFLLNLFHKIYKQIDFQDETMKRIGLGFIIFFIVLNFGDSYLLGHFTSFVFIYLASFIYRQDG